MGTQRSQHYFSYLNSATWREKRKLVLARDGKKCQRCEQTKFLHVHHLTYKNLGNEPLEDLLTLCNNCHEAEHAKPRWQKPKPGICLTCSKKFSSGSYPRGGGRYCSRACHPRKARKPKRISRKVRVISVDPGTLRTKGTAAAVEEANWVSLASGEPLKRTRRTKRAPSQRQPHQQKRSRKPPTPRGLTKKEKVAAENQRLHELQVRNKERRERKALT